MTTQKIREEHNGSYWEQRSTTAASAGLTAGSTQLDQEEWDPAASFPAAWAPSQSGPQAATTHILLDS